jgi:putative membrane protein
MDLLLNNVTLNNWIATLMLSDHPAALLAQAGVKAGAKAATKAPVKQTNWILGMLFTLVVTAIAFYIISLITPIGVEIDSPVTAIVCAIVFGALNIVSQRAEDLLNMTWILAPLALALNMLMFWITDLVIGGFRIRNGILGIFLGSVALTIVQFLIRETIKIVF